MRSDLRQTFDSKHLLVTGVTGFVGKVWLAMLLDRLPSVERITVLIRAQKGNSAEERFTKIYDRNPAFRALRQRLGTDLHDLIKRKIVVVEGEIGRRFAGLSATRAQELMSSVDAVIHFAGLTDFEPDPLAAIEANIDGALHIAELATLSSSKRYIHCSTTYVAGTSSGEVQEELHVGVCPTGHRFDAAQEFSQLKTGLAEVDNKSERIDYAMCRAKALGWPNIYTYTKGLAEHLVALRGDTQTTTIRPAIVECAAQYPFVGWNEGINTSGPIVWLLSTSFCRFPARDKNKFDVVPVDTVARACTLIIAAALNDEAQDVYHIGSSHLNPFTFERAVELTGLAQRRQHEASDNVFDRAVLKHLYAITVDADRQHLLGVDQIKKGIEELRHWLRGIDVEDNLPPRSYRRWGHKVNNNRRQWMKSLRTQERKLNSVQQMLRQYKPFIFDHDYVFRTDHVVAESNKLSADDASLFAFNIEAIDWRRYWLEVEVPGLEKWSIPVLRGEKVPQDMPLASDKNLLDANQVCGRILSRVIA